MPTQRKASVMKRKKQDDPLRKPDVVQLKPTDEGSMKRLGGAQSDAWNAHFMGKLIAALPGGLSPNRSETLIPSIATGMMAIEPEDPLAAMLAGQMIAANEAACDMYRRAWIAEQSFDVRTKYLALADKAARTVATLAEALDRHRNRGQQQIVVKHVTVNADQAVVTDQLVSGSYAPGGGRHGTQDGEQPHALENASGLTMFGNVEAVGQAVPVASR
jgi:hypothetical protein